MLVLTRRQGQGILIGPDVEVVVLCAESGHVRLGIRAPRRVSVLRRELLEQVQAENREALGSDPAGARALLDATMAARRDLPTAETAMPDDARREAGEVGSRAAGGPADPPEKELSLR